MPEDLLKQSKKLKVIGTHRSWSQWCVLFVKIYQALCLPLSIFFYLCYTSTKKFTFRKKNTIALDSLQNLLEQYQASSLANTSQHLSPSSAQFLNVSITSLTNHSLVFTNYKYFQLVASPMLPLENTTKGIKCRFTTSFPPFRKKKGPALTALFSPTHTSQPFYYIIPLSYINPSLFLPDHPSNNQTCSSIVHLASGRPHPPCLGDHILPHYLILDVPQISQIQHTRTFHFTAILLSLFPPSVFPTLVNSTILHTAAQAKNHLIPSFLTSHI